MGKGKEPFRFRARYAGTCACCGQDFSISTPIKYNGSNEIIVVDCLGAQGIPTEQEAAEARAKRCPSCFTVHAPHQEECY